MTNITCIRYIMGDNIGTNLHCGSMGDLANEFGDFLPEKDPNERRGDLILVVGVGDGDFDIVQSR